MNYFFAMLCLVLIATSCSRQPVGIAGSPNTPVQAPIEDGTVETNPKIDEARALRTQEELAQGELPPEKAGTGNLPDEAELKARRRDEVRQRRDRMNSPQIESNETAEIENQASVGQAPLTDPDVVTPPEQENPAILTFQKSNCYGDCEAYTFNLQTGGMTSLLVDQGEIAQGLYNRQLYSVDYERLNNSIDSLRSVDLEPLYPVREEVPTDIPYRLITLPDENGFPRNIKVYSGAPPALERFLDRLELLIGEQSWEKVIETGGDR